MKGEIFSKEKTYCFRQEFTFCHALLKNLWVTHVRDPVYSPSGILQFHVCSIVCCLCEQRVPVDELWRKRTTNVISECWTMGIAIHTCSTARHPAEPCQSKRCICQLVASTLCRCRFFFTIRDSSVYI